MRTFRRKFLLSSILVILVDSGIRLIQPLLIGRIVRYLVDDDPVGGVSYEVAGGCAIGLIVSIPFNMFMIYHGYVLHARHGNNVRQALTHLIYKKILKLSMSSCQETDLGHILNILANDMNRFEEMSYWMIFLFIGPLAASLSLAITYYYLGISSLAGFVILILFVPFQMFMGRLFSRFRRNTTEITDKRINLMGELVSAMKLIKVYCWERHFASVVRDIRTKEIHAMRKTYFLEGVNSAVFFVATKLIMFACFVTHVLMNGRLDPEACLCHYGHLQCMPGSNHSIPSFSSWFGRESVWLPCPESISFCCWKKDQLLKKIKCLKEPSQ